MFEIVTDAIAFGDSILEVQRIDGFYGLIFFVSV